MAEVLSAEQLTKYYGQNRGIIDLDFSVEAGEVFGFLGPNGAGKTTTIRTLLDLISPPPAGALFGLDSRDSVAFAAGSATAGDFAFEPLTGGESSLLRSSPRHAQLGRAE